MLAKISQSYHANKKHAPETDYQPGDKVMLSTLHRRHEYKAGKKDRVAKFMPHFDGPYSILSSHPETSSYTLDLPNSPNTFPTFHASVLKPFFPNDPDLFPHRDHPQPCPIVTADGVEEFFINKIIDDRKRGCGFQYLVRWVREGEEADCWLSRKELEDCEALDKWLAQKE